MNLTNFTLLPGNSTSEDDFLFFAKEIAQEEQAKAPRPNFKILLVDDDLDVHLSTRLALKNFSFAGRGLEFFSATSGAEAFSLLQEHLDTAVMLLDVVMESEQAGLNLIGQIRHHLGLRSLRIILRTGQPGYAPALDTVANYDINDYKTKTELTQDSLQVALITALRSYLLYQELIDLAYEDPLTGLLNRKGFLNMLDLKLQNLSAEEVKKLQLVFLDLDEFSIVNDTFGDEQGDSLLISFARRLESFSNTLFTARFDADRFALLIKGEAGCLQNSAELNKNIVFNDIEHPISFSLGVVCCSESAQTTELLNFASLALKKAKTQNHGSCVTFNPLMAQEQREDWLLLNSLKRDLEAGQLYLEYQPQLDLVSQKILGVEALVRWHPTGGKPIPPNRFIPLAEKSGLILALGNWVLKQALQDLKLLQQLQPNLRMAVNVSALQFNQADFPDLVAEAITAAKQTGHYLDLEITESVGILGSREVEARFAQLKQLGVTLSIDDFGTGFSNFSYLEKLSADRLKIDASFVAKLDDSDSGSRIVEMIISLGKLLNFKVLAEGVETSAQFKELQALGCEEGQGYLFSRPLGLDALCSWIEQHHASCN